MKRYYMSIDTLVVSTRNTEAERIEEAKKKFLELLLADEIEIICVDEVDASLEE